MQTHTTHNTTKNIFIKNKYIVAAWRHGNTSTLKSIQKCVIVFQAVAQGIHEMVKSQVMVIKN